MEWVLILILAMGSVTLPHPFATEQECVGAGESALPNCTAAVDLLGRVEQICFPRRFICAPQPKSKRRSK
jgi:hypothetical protein